MKITFYGHSCFGVETGGVHLLFDPFISPNEKAAHIELDKVPADYILISHAHGDHIADVAAIAQRTGARLVSNFEIVSWFESRHGLKNYHPMNHGGRWNFPFGRVKYVNAVHSSTFPDGSSGGAPGGFVVETPEGNFYYSGDTALSYDMKLIGEHYLLDFAFLCMGDNFTMGMDEAAIAADYINCDRIVGMHYDTFGYILLDHQAAIRHFEQKGKTLLLPAIGETIEL